MRRLKAETVQYRHQLCDIEETYERYLGVFPIGNVSLALLHISQHTYDKYRRQTEDQMEVDGMSPLHTPPGKDCVDSSIGRQMADVVAMQREPYYDSNIDILVLAKGKRTCNCFSLEDNIANCKNVDRFWIGKLS